MANTTIALRSSGTAAAVPSLGVIANGEIALNYADGIIYYKTSSNTLGSIRTTQPAGLTTEIQFNDAGSFGSNSGFTFAKTTGTVTAPTLNVSVATAATSNTTGALIVAGGVGIKGDVYSTNQFVRGDVVAGLADGAVLGGATNPIFAAIGNTDQYIQSYQINYSNTANASSDFVAYPNNGNDANGWIDMGITSNAYACTAYSITGRNEGYIFMSAPTGSGTSGNLVFGTDSTGTYNAIQFYTGGFNKAKGLANVVMTSQTTSTSNVTGSLQVVGGVGIKGNVVADGIIFPDGTRQTTAVSGTPATLGDVLALSIALG